MSLTVRSDHTPRREHLLENLPPSQLPLISDVLARYLFLRRSLPDSLKKASENTVIDETLAIWTKAYIKTKARCTVVESLRNIVKQHSNTVRHPERTENIKEFWASCNKLWDIVHSKAKFRKEDETFYMVVLPLIMLSELPPGITHKIREFIVNKLVYY